MPDDGRPSGWVIMTSTDGASGEIGTASLSVAEILELDVDCLVTEHGYSGQQAYCICSVAANLRYSQVVDVPNFVASAILPLSIFTDGT